jgi:hypothetical protein
VKPGGSIPESTRQLVVLAKDSYTSVPRVAGGPAASVMLKQLQNGCKNGKGNCLAALQAILDSVVGQMQVG